MPMLLAQRAMLLAQRALMNAFHYMCNWRLSFFMSVYLSSEIFFNRHVVAFFEIIDLKEVLISCYLCNDGTMLILKFQNEDVVHYTL